MYHILHYMHFFFSWLEVRRITIMQSNIVYNNLTHNDFYTNTHDKNSGHSAFYLKVRLYILT